MKQLGFWLAALIGLPFFALAFVVSSVWFGLKIGWLAVEDVFTRS